MLCVRNINNIKSHDYQHEEKSLNWNWNSIIWVHFVIMYGGNNGSCLVSKLLLTNM